MLTHIIDFLPGVTPYESTTVAEFFPAGNHVRMVVTLHPMHDEAFSRMQAEGFTSQLTKLDRRFGVERGRHGRRRHEVTAGVGGDVTVKS